MRWFALLAITIVSFHTLARSVRANDAEHFEKVIRPLLVTHCQKCHNAQKAKGGLDLSSANGFKAGGDNGIAVVPGNPDKSRLIQAIRYESDEKMPPSGKLADADIATLTAWVKAGATWPADRTTTTTSKRFDVRTIAANHWAYQPIRNNHSHTSIDQFLDAKRHTAGLRAADEADAETLIRRVTFDLLGLPPTPAEIDDFLRDRDYTKLVERLLASPHYGERWGRHWLDLMRYADTRGHEFDFEIPNAWRYRDYVIRAFNSDLPFDQFIREQIAGDRLPPRWHAKQNEALIATGFWHLGEAKHSPVDSKQDEADRIDNMIDVFGKAFLGQTIACARCHDHKFDPIATADYYGLYGILTSSRYSLSCIDDPAPVLAKLDELRRLRPPANAPAANEIMRQWVSHDPAFRLTDGIPHSGRESLALRGAVRSPTFRIQTKSVAVRVAGTGSRVRLILNHLQLIQAPIYGELQKAVSHGDEFRWLLFDVSMWPGQRAYIEGLDEGDGYLAIADLRFVDHPPTNEKLVAETPKPGDDRIRSLERELAAAPQVAVTMTDGTGLDEPVMIRGNPKTPGAAAPRRFLELFAANATSPATGSGRVELADAVTQPANPLPARVWVNRVWQHHFGVGLVKSPDDFGHQGEAPTHPELLDWLATRFVDDGWSVKQLHRRILHSAAYRMSAKPHPATAELAAKVDPQNRLLHRMNIRRLEGEAIRDAMLAVSGRLNRTIGGPGVAPHLTPHMDGRGRPGKSGPLDGDGRRSVYLQVRRNFPNSLLSAFDQPTPFTAIGRRNNSNVPAQALVMMNNPFVIGEAERWAKRNTSDGADVVTMYREAFGRVPTAEERELAEAFIRDTDRAAFAHALFNAKAFVWIE